jgi:hypothetical protein
MTESENTTVTQQEQEKIVQPQATAPVTQPEVHEDPDWRAVREQRKIDKAQREAAEKRALEAQAQAEALKAAMEAAFAKMPANPYAQPSDPQYEESEDERIEKKVQAALSAREASYAKERAQREITELPSRLRKEFPDYDAVVNDENGAYLEYHHPELLKALLNQPENFETCSNTYKLVKKLIPGIGSSKKEEAKSQSNLLKPKSSSSATITQPGEQLNSYRLSEERKAANWARMQADIRSI